MEAARESEQLLDEDTGLPPARAWRLLPHDPAAVARLAGTLGVAPVVAHLLLNRNLDEADAARRFLDAPLSGLHPPELLPGAAEAAGRLYDAVRAGRRICVYGDYDVDGTTGTAILLLGLRLLGAEPDFHVPHRLEEGYGLNSEALRKIAADGNKVVVTVDCGIGSLAEAELARELGVELIVTDHHEPRERRPDAAVVVHPRLPPGVYPFGGLSGSGVAFKVAWKLAQLASGGPKVTARFRDYLLDSVALATLGTVADVVPLHDENRIFVRHGLARLRQAPSAGLQALIEAAGLQSASSLRASDISFKLAPRLNAVGRLGCARLVVELLTTASPQRALDHARYLEEQNQQRQSIERRMVAQAREMVEAEGHAASPALVLASGEWHGGVIGIVAGRLAEQYARPVLMIALRQDGAGLPVGSGSGRSVPGFALHEALKACGDCLISHGGHRAAAGFRLRADAIDAFRERFCDYAARHFPDGPPAPRLTLDAEVPLSALTMGLIKELDRLEPYGSENGRPLFLAGGLKLVGDPRRMGGGERHMSFRVSQGDTVMRAVAFGMGDRFDELMSAGGSCCLAFTPKINEWQGYRSVELEVADFQPGPRAALV
jgi:single-stranded-DNA-specific exonuclease